MPIRKFRAASVKVTGQPLADVVGRRRQNRG